MAAYLRQAADLQIHAVDGGYIVRNTGTNAVHHLNGTAALLLELCTGDMTVDQIVASVQRTFGLPTRQLRGVREAVDALIGVGLVVRVKRATRTSRADV